MSAITIGSLTSLQLGWTLIRVSKKPRNQILFPKNCKMHFFVCRKYNWLSPRIPYQNGINTHRDSVKVTVSSSLSNRAKDVSQIRNCNPALQLRSSGYRQCSANAVSPASPADEIPTGGSLQYTEGKKLFLSAKKPDLTEFVPFFTRLELVIWMAPDQYLRACPLRT